MSMVKRANAHGRPSAIWKASGRTIRLADEFQRKPSTAERSSLTDALTEAQPNWQLGLYI
ncbi:unnamed protein product [Penicillium roqueforti FM164]|uniref:Genomic scaffold, ProqFM164S04 n=1 Tax=Penicillium roqueforti (strain FM164) TaxID=1365484 RepID=W6R070_PENRF|nr:unnamed protein product [Penicillium roqueforti FM164]